MVRFPANKVISSLEIVHFLVIQDLEVGSKIPFEIFEILDIIIPFKTFAGLGRIVLFPLRPS